MESLFARAAQQAGRPFDALPSRFAAGSLSFGCFERESGLAADEAALRRLGLMDAEGRITNAGALFADGDNVPGSRILCTRWAGRRAGEAAAALDAGGPLLEQLAAAMAFASEHARLSSHPAGREPAGYAARAVAEALVNALAHRDYARAGAEVQLGIYDDRIEVWSPGEPPFDLAAAAGPVSVRRNPAVSGVLAGLGLMTLRGAGLFVMARETAALPGWREACRPRFLADALGLRVVLPSVLLRH
ncbi:MAG: hypothetical protein HUK26_03860 [Duodenibacillus sp.]|nr:hypothetical protein [Duodenibacillus sp.]